jgi:UDP-glucose 4-epimerase
MKILVTGATGYIGAHFVKTAALHGMQVVATDFNWNQNDISKWCDETIDWDFRKPAGMRREFDKVVHIGATGKVPLSVKNPWLYYESNVIGTKNVIDFADCDHFIYCSTGSAFSPQTSPYAATKHGGELLTKQFNDKHSIVRFYNVSGNDGFNKFDDEYSHLIRKAAAVANGKFDTLYVHGTDYDTRDGTCVRNYTHVFDIVESLYRITNNQPTGVVDCLGVPEGVTVKEAINTMANVSGSNLHVVEGPRREGDIVTSTVPTQSLYFKQTKTLEDICEDALRHEV